MLWIFFLIAIFIMLLKNTFGQKKFWISCKGSKVPFWQNWKIAKVALLNPCKKFEFFFSQKHSAKSRIYAEKSTKKGFSKKALVRIDFFFCFRFLWISRKPGTLNWEQVFFWLSKNLYKQCVYFLHMIIRLTIWAKRH